MIAVKDDGDKNIRLVKSYENSKYLLLLLLQAILDTGAQATKETCSMKWGVELKLDLNGE